MTTTLYGVACLGQMVVMLTRNIDLSLGFDHRPLGVRVGLGDERPAATRPPSSAS